MTRWHVGHRVGPAFFPTWLGGRFSPAHLAHALGGGSTDGVLADHVLAGQSALVAVAAHLTDVEAATLPCAGVTACQNINCRTHPDWDNVPLEMTDGKGVDHILELGGPDT